MGRVIWNRLHFTLYCYSTGRDSGWRTGERPLYLYIEGKREIKYPSRTKLNIVTENSGCGDDVRNGYAELF